MDPSGRTVVPAIHTVSSDEFGVEAANHRADAVEVGARRVSWEGVRVRCEIVSVVTKCFRTNVAWTRSFFALSFSLWKLKRSDPE